MFPSYKTALRKVLSDGKRKENSSHAKRYRNRPLRMEQLEERQVLAQIVPVQGNDTSLTSGGIDFLYMRANTATGSIVHQTDAVIAAVEDATDDYYRRNSGGGSFLGTFDVTPVLDLTGLAFSSFTSMQNAMRQAAAAAGFNLSNYTRFGYGFGSQNFNLGGGAVGFGDASSGSLLVPDAVLSDFESGTRAFIHESLHSLGLGHANNLEYGDQIYDENRILSAPLGNTPTATQAGIDPYHFMGGEAFAYLNADISAYQKYYIGWIGAGNVTVAPDDPTGVYRIYQYRTDALPANQKVALQVGDGGNPDGAIWLTYEPDAPNPDVVKNGVLASLVDPIRPAVEWRLDLTPNSRQAYDPDTPADIGRQVRLDLEDAAAAVGETYAIPGFDFEFTPIATGGSGQDQWVDIEVTKAEVATVDENRHSYEYDLGTPTSPVAAGSEQISDMTAGNIDWLDAVSSTDRGVGSSDTNRDFVFASQPATLEHRVRNGLWRVELTTGDDDVALDDMQVRAEGALVAADIDSAASQFATTMFDVEVTDGSLSLEFSDNGGVDPSWRLNGLSLDLLEHRVDTSLDILNYDFGTESSPIQELGFLDPIMLTADANGDISWSGAVQEFVDIAGFVVDGEVFDVGDLGIGIAAADGATGSGFIMYSEESVTSRFPTNTPITASNLMAVRFVNNQWQYSTNNHTEFITFTPAPNDRLLALVNYTNDTVTSLEGQRSQVNGIDLGYDSGNLSYFADQYNGGFNDGEFQVTTSVSSAGSPTDVQKDGVMSTATRTLEHKVANGHWRVWLQMGDATARDNMQVRAEGNLISNNIDSAAGQHVYVTTSGASTSEASFDVLVTDGSLSLEFSDNGGTNAGWSLNGMSLERVGTVIDTSQTSFAYDLGSAYTLLEPGYDRLSEEFTQGDVRFTGGTLDSRDRYRFSTFPDPQQRFQDFVFSNSTRTLEHKVSNGTWRVTMTMGDGLVPNVVTNASVRAEGELIDGDIDTTFTTGLSAVPDVRTGLEYVTRTGGSQSRASFEVEVTDGSLSLQLGGAWRLSSMELQKVGGDFDSDGDVDGSDFLSWQRDFGTPYTVDDLLNWQGNYGNVDALLAAASVVSPQTLSEDPSAVILPSQAAESLDVSPLASLPSLYESLQRLDASERDEAENLNANRMGKVREIYGRKANYRAYEAEKDDAFTSPSRKYDQHSGRDESTLPEEIDIAMAQLELEFERIL